MKIIPMNSQIFTGKYLIKLPNNNAKELMPKLQDKDNEGTRVYDIAPDELLYLNGDDAKAIDPIYEVCGRPDRLLRLLDAFKANAIVLDLK